MNAFPIRILSIFPQGDLLGWMGILNITLLFFPRMLPEALGPRSVVWAGATWQSEWSPGARGWCWTPWGWGWSAPRRRSTTKPSGTARYCDLHPGNWIFHRLYTKWNASKGNSHEQDLEGRECCSGLRVQLPAERLCLIPDVHSLPVPSYILE